MLLLLFQFEKTFTHISKHGNSPALYFQEQLNLYRPKNLKNQTHFTVCHVMLG